MISYFGSGPTWWEERVFEALLFGPYLMVAILGKPHWAKYVLLAHFGFLGFALFQFIFGNGQRGFLTGFLPVLAPIMALILLLTALATRFLAQLSNRFLWKRSLD